MDKNKPKREIKPLIKTSTLKDKSVNVKDTMNFGRTTGIEELKDKTKKPKENPLVKRRKEIMKTQKMSMDVILKLDILDPFLRNAENIEHDKKLSINDKIDILIKSYLSEKITTRQLEGFNAIYENYNKG